MFLISVMYFRFFSLLSPFGEGSGASFEQTWIPFTQGYFVPSLVGIGCVVLEMKKKMLKVYNNNNDDDGQLTNCDQNSNLGPSVQVSWELEN